jgi:hypothetical protein
MHCRFSRLAGCVVLLALAGCGDTGITFREVKRVDERVTPDEMAEFWEIVDALPGKKLPTFQTPFLPPPQWSSHRTMPVNELVKEERRALDERWSPARLGKQFEHNRALQRALRRAEMTPEQFAGFVLNIGCALNRTTLTEDQDLARIQARGQIALRRIEKDDRLFSSLSDEGAYHVLQSAAWLPLIDRVQRLQQVPEENVELALQFRDRLKQAFPEEFTANPIAPFSRVLNDIGVPFEEQAGSGYDTDIHWNPLDSSIVELPLDPARDLNQTRLFLPAADEIAATPDTKR